MLRCCMAVGEVAMTAATNADFFSDGFTVIQYQDTQTALTRYPRTEQAGSTGTDDDGVPWGPRRDAR